MLIVPAALVALGLVLFLVLRGGGGGGGIFGGGPDDTTPALHFRVTKAQPIVVTDKDHKQFDSSAAQVAAQVTQTMTALYTEAFLDPSNWRDGSYDNVWPLFDEGARASAQQDGTTLTLGPPPATRTTRSAARGARSASRCSSIARRSPRWRWPS